MLSWSLFPHSHFPLHPVSMHALSPSVHLLALSLCCCMVPFSSYCRQIVSCYQDEQSQGSFVNLPGKHQHKTSVNPSFVASSRMISLFPEYASDIASSSSSSSSPHSTHSPPFFNDMWLERVHVAARRAKAWRNGDSSSGIHQQHCIVSLSWSFAYDGHQ